MSEINPDPAETARIYFAEERLKLERERLEVERERLEAWRDHLAAENRLAGKTRRPWLAFCAVALLSALCFTGGLLAGAAFNETSQQRRREANLAKALSQLDSLQPQTNSIPELARQLPEGAHRNVSVLVIQ